MNKKTISFLIGLFSLILIRVLGIISIAEVIAIIIMPFIYQSGTFRNNTIKKIYFLLLLWMLGVFFADYYNNSSISNFLKGIGNVLMFFPSFILAYWLLKDNYQNIIYYLAGKSISSFLSVYLFPADTIKDLINNDGVDSFMNIWFVYLLAPLIMYFASLLYFKGKTYKSITIIILFAFWSLFNNSRNIFLIWSFAGMILVIFGKVTESNKFKKYLKFKKNILLILCILFITGWGMKSFYEYSASNGILGKRAHNKYINQKTGNTLGILSGRVDFFQCLLGISENPIIGYGSYAPDKTKIRLRTYEIIHDKIGINDMKRWRTENTIVPRHSYILGAWMFSGILSTPFWVYILFLIFVFFKTHLFNDTKMIALFILISLSLLWNIFFSPLQQRLDLCITIVAIILAMNINQSSHNLIST